MTPATPTHGSGSAIGTPTVATGTPHIDTKVINDDNSRLTYLLSRIMAGRSHDNHFRKLFKMAMNYVKLRNQDVFVDDCVWVQRFPEIVDTFLSFLDKPSEVYKR